MKRRYIFPGVAIGLVIFCQCGATAVPRAGAAEALGNIQPTVEEKEKQKVLEQLKEWGVSDKTLDAVKEEFQSFRPSTRSLPQGATKFEGEKHHLETHDSCERLHQPAAVEACKENRE